MQHWGYQLHNIARKAQELLAKFWRVGHCSSPVRKLRQRTGALQSLPVALGSALGRKARSHAPEQVHRVSQSVLYGSIG
jgi:hypothetical protein